MGAAKLFNLMRHITFLFCLAILFTACTGNMTSKTSTEDKPKEKQSFDSVCTVNLKIKDYSARGNVSVEYFVENNNSAEPAKFTNEYQGFDLTSDLAPSNDKIEVISDSTILFNKHVLNKKTDSSGNVFYIWEEFKDDLKLEKSAVKLVRKENVVHVYAYFISFENDRGGTYKQFKDLYKKNLKAQQEKDNAEILRQEKTGSTPKELYLNNFFATLVTTEYTIE